MWNFIFPCKYLEIPLSLEKLTREQIQPIIDRIADQPSGWKSDMMNRDCCRIQVQYVLTSMLVYLAMSLGKPTWALKAIDKIRRVEGVSCGEDAKIREATVLWLRERFVGHLRWAALV